jgi:hypothetical protein
MSGEDYTTALRELARATEPRQEVVSRITRALRAEAHSTGHILAHLPEPNAGAADRVRRRLALRPVRQRWLMPAAILVPIAAAGLVALRTPTPEPEPRSHTLAGTVLLSEAPAVALHADGEGEAVGAGATWQVTWETGLLALDIEPDAGVRLGVHTREADITVVGTAFEVQRSPLGTRVHVDRGAVDVRCVDGTEVQLEGGQEQLCIPASPAGLLGRALALRDGNATHDEVLDTLAKGLSSSEPGDPVRGELLAHQLEPLLAMAQSNRALEVAEQYLDEAATAARATEMRRFAAGLSYQEKGCAAAVRHLALLEPKTPQELALAEHCAGELH